MVTVIGTSYFVIRSKYCLGVGVKKDEIGWGCGTYGRE